MRDVTEGSWWKWKLRWIFGGLDLVAGFGRHG